MISIYFQSRTSSNVVVIGHSGVGKSSLVNMLCPSANVPIANDMTGCTKHENVYSCDLGRQQSCTLHDTIGLEEGSWGFLWASKAEAAQVILEGEQTTLCGVLHARSKTLFEEIIWAKF
jgi:predicted GTPase